jgi:NAD(P)-dependent dehydrogenase (short-subunit alcohol dehydrogenase family)
VAMSFLPEEAADAQIIAGLIEQAGRKALLLPGDITDPAFCQSLVTQAVEGLGGLDILVNNAGKQTNQESIADISPEQFDVTLKTNLYAMFWITKAAVAHLPPGAAIINTASVVAYKAPEILLDYSTTKAGIIAFTKVLAKQLIEKGIRVNAVAPGPFWTALQPSGGQPQDSIEKFGSSVPLGRPGQPVEIAPIYVFLASQEASYVTGETYGATGGTGLA